MDSQNRTHALPHALRPHPAAGPRGIARRILIAQIALGAVATTVVAAVSGAGAAAGTLLGLLCMALPQWCAHQMLRWVGLGLPRLIALEALRVGVSAALLLWAMRVIPGFSWSGALIGLIIAVKAPWFVVLREDRHT